MAIDVAPADSEAQVILALGTYTGAGNRDIDLKGKTLVVKSTNPDDPAVVAGTIIDCQGSNSDPHRGFVLRTDEPAGTAIQGLTITNGYAISDSNGNGGGAICCSSASLTIENCVLRQCYGQYDGGAISSYASNTVIRECAILDSRCVDSGGAICSSGGTMLVAGCMISGNTAGYAGGALYVYSSSDVVLENCTLRQNTASQYGGAMYLSSGNVTLPTAILSLTAPSMAAVPSTTPRLQPPC